MIRALLILLASGAMLTACAGDAPETQTAEAPEASGETWTARGVYLGSRFEGQAATVDHEAIPGFMDAMQMDFLLASPEAIDGLAEGDKVSFRLDYNGSRVVASGFQPLPDTTTLALASGAAPDSTAD